MLTDRTAVRHFLEMLAAMIVGMVVLGPLWPHLPGGATVHTLVMATNMTIGMAAWMAFRRHRPVAVAEMALAMYVPFVVLFPAFWAGWLSAATMMVIGHVLMLPAMVLAMLRRPAEYTCHHRHA
jgi:flagellar biosynthetic protein FliP